MVLCCRGISSPISLSLCCVVRGQRSAVGGSSGTFPERDPSITRASADPGRRAHQRPVGPVPPVPSEALQKMARRRNRTARRRRSQTTGWRRAKAARSSASAPGSALRIDCAASSRLRATCSATAPARLSGSDSSSDCSRAPRFPSASFAAAVGVGATVRRSAEDLPARGLVAFGVGSLIFGNGCGVFRPFHDGILQRSVFRAAAIAGDGPYVLSGNARAACGFPQPLRRAWICASSAARWSSRISCSSGRVSAAASAPS